MSHIDRRDYSLAGAETACAAERGLAGAEWFRPAIDPAAMRVLQMRTNGRAARDVVLWLALLTTTGAGAWLALGSWWAIPAFAAYGALYGGSADARWHECGHGTAFRSRSLNDAVYYVASFMLLRGPTVWRWSHYRHHTDTVIVGRDAEILFERPSSVWTAAVAYTHLRAGSKMFWRLVRHAVKSFDNDARALVPEADLGRVARESRVFVGIIGATGVGALAAGSFVPLLFIGLPSIYGGWLMVFFGITQHAGLREDVLDHRLNTRTVRMNPLFRFLYLNMNYHVEHHIFPSVPYHALPSLHVAIGDQLATPKRSTWHAYREIWSTLWRQRRDPTYELELDLPKSRFTPAVIDVGAPHWMRVDGMTDLGPADALDVGELRRVDIDGDTFVLGRLDDDEVVFLDGECTHQHVHLCDGTLVDGAIECPKHNGRFDARTGEPIRRPVRTPLRAYRVEVSGGRIVTQLLVRAERRCPVSPQE